MIGAFILLFVFVVTVMSAVSDFRTMRIPNAYVVALLAAFVPAYLLGMAGFGAWWEHAGAFAFIFIVTYGMFCFRMLGGGDAKLASAAALWIGLKGLMPFLFYMSVVGGLLGLVALFLRRKKPFKDAAAESWIAQAQNGKSAVPYGIAISLGMWAAFFHTGFFHHQIDEVIRIIH